MRDEGQSARKRCTWRIWLAAASATISCSSDFLAQPADSSTDSAAAVGSPASALSRRSVSPSVKDSPAWREAASPRPMRLLLLGRSPGSPCNVSQWRRCQLVLAQRKAHSRRRRRGREEGEGEGGGCPHSKGRTCTHRNITRMLSTAQHSTS